MRKVLALIVVGMPGVVLADDAVIAVLGDSLVQGYGLPEEAGLVPQLQNWLNANGTDARLINAGVSGDTTAGGLSRVDWTLTPDVDGMIISLGGNDMLRGLDPAVSRANLDGILQAAVASEVRVLLVGVEAAGNFGPDYKEEFDSIFPQLATKYQVSYAGQFFDGLKVNGDDPASISLFLQPDGIHPNADGVKRIVEFLGPEVQQLATSISD